MAYRDEYGKLGMTGGFYPLADFPLINAQDVYVNPEELQINGESVNRLGGAEGALTLILNQLAALAQFDESVVPVFVGTKAEYDTKDAAGEIAVGTIVIITDDNGVTTGGNTSAKLGQAILGYMKLGQI